MTCIVSGGELNSTDSLTLQNTERCKRKIGQSRVAVVKWDGIISSFCDDRSLAYKKLMT